jgi:rubrerythrin
MRRNVMSRLRGSRTEANLRSALSNETAANHTFLSHARAAEAEGYNGLAGVLRSGADMEAGRAAGHLEYLVADHAAGMTGPSGKTAAALMDPVIALASQRIDMYAGMAKTAEEEGFDDIADWFRTLATAGPAQLRKLRHAVENVEDHDQANRGFGRRA